MKHFKAIAAMSLNRVIGNGNKIPWHLPEDFKWFKERTLGNVVVMGRKTFESLGKPLPNRTNLVLTRHPKNVQKAYPELFGESKVRKSAYRAKPHQFGFRGIATPEKTEVSLISGFRMIDPNKTVVDVFICGGAQIYEQALPLCSDLYLTLVKREVEGDAFFPPFEDRFEQVAILRDEPEFQIIHYRNRSLRE